MREVKKEKSRKEGEGITSEEEKHREASREGGAPERSRLEVIICKGGEGVKEEVGEGWG